uniref:Uncharacterized protein n=1 Tax=Oryza punctata TaxID=4537 RepID=A0A0E0JLD6_ORYPU
MEDIIHASVYTGPFSCVSTCMIHLPESQRYLCVSIISLRDTTLTPTDQDVKGHFGSDEGEMRDSRRSISSMHHCT